MRLLAQASPAGNHSQSVGEVSLVAAGETNGRDTRSIKDGRVELEEGDVVVEAENVKVIVIDDFLDSLDLRVVARDVVTADEGSDFSRFEV